MLYSLVALQAGGFSHPWASAYVLCILLVGLALIVFFVVWEWKFAKFPMVPRDMFAGQSIMGTAFFIAFVAGMNFYSLLNFFVSCILLLSEHRKSLISTRSIIYCKQC